MIWRGGYSALWGSITVAGALCLGACESSPAERGSKSTNEVSNERRNKSPEAGRTARREPTSENPSEGVECERTDVSPTKTVEGRVELQSGGPPGSARADTTIPYFVADDGTRWIISTSRNLEPFEDGHVRLTGRTYEPSPCVAHIEGTHFELRDIERVDSKPDTQTDTD